MKKVFLVIAFALTLLACNNEKTPSVKALFSTDKDEYSIDEPVFITNESIVEGGVIGLCRWEWDGNESFQDEIDVISFDKPGEKEIKLTVYADGGGSMDSYSKTVKIKDEFEPEEGVIYVGPVALGSGDGSSWNNAMAVSSFASILSGDASAWNGKTYYVQGGEHVLNNEGAIKLSGKGGTQCSLTIVGGFSGTGDDENTVFSGNSALPIFEITGAVNLFLNRCELANASSGAVNTPSATVLDTLPADIVITPKLHIPSYTVPVI